MVLVKSRLILIVAFLLFGEEDAPRFFGREAFTHDLITAVHRQSFVALFGSSGSGKSSVMRAGLVAGLRPDSRWAITLFRPSSRPFHALAAALIPCLSPGLTDVAQLAESAKLAESLQEGLVSLVEVTEKIADSRGENGRFLLIADQFEELYTLCPDPSLRQAFLDVLLEAVLAQPPHQEPRFTFLFGLRADFLGQALDYRPFADAIQHQDIKLGPLSAMELRRAIQQPAQLKNVQFEVGLIGRILTGVGDKPGNLPLLQFALTTLWPRQKNGLITHEAYKEIGKVAGALSVYADEVLAGLTAEERESVRRIFVQLVRPGEGTEDTRRLATRAELGEENWQLVHKLADARLVVTSRDAFGHDVVEVAHEALIRGWDCLRNWMAAGSRVSCLARADAGVCAPMGSDGIGILVCCCVVCHWKRQNLGWQNGRLRLASWSKHFIRASVQWRENKAAQEAKFAADRARLRKRVMAGVVVAFVLMVLLTATAVWQWRQAVARGEAVLAAEQQVALEQAQARTMFSRQLALHGESLLPEDHALAALLSVEAANTANTMAARRSLLAALNAEPTLREIRHDHLAAVTSIASSADDQFVISGDVAGNLHIWHQETGETAVVDLLDSLGTIKAIAVNPVQPLLAIAGRQGTIQLWDLQKQQPLDLIVVPDRVGILRKCLVLMGPYWPYLRKIVDCCCGMR